MPLVRGENGSVSIEYSLPKELKKLIDNKFAETFIEEMIVAFPYTKDSDSVMAGTLGMNAGTCGMDDALKNTCKKLNIIEFQNENLKLEGWYDYDLFMDEIADMVSSIHFGKIRSHELFEEFYKENYEPYEDSDDEAADKTDILSEGDK